MTTVIDERVVEMRFNNADFEKNVAQSMSTLEKLKNSLNFDSAKSLENLGKASKNFSMENVATQVEIVQAKFSALQIVGMTALSELTKAAMGLGAKILDSIIGPIKTGGMNRAMNIEQAKFQLEGLHVAWTDIEKDINYGVKDTAYGLDAAAKAASQLVTSGVEFGETWGETGNSPMAKALRGISGVAAMTSSSYEDISEIFTAIAGKGKAMTGEFNRLGQRGLNAAGAVADYFNKVNAGTVETTESVKEKVKELTGGLNVTELEIRDFATKSKIDFELFSYAMDDAFGEHAKEANKTFTGALSNVKAALSRIGANFATPYLENMRKVFVNLIPVINNVNEALKPMYNSFEAFMKMFEAMTGNFLKSEGLKSGITTIINAISRAFDGLITVLYTVKLAFNSIFPKNGAGEMFLRVAEAISTFVDKVLKIVLTEDVLMNLFSFFQGIFSVGKLVIDIFKQLFGVISPIASPLQLIFTILTTGLGIIGRVLTIITTFIRENVNLTTVLQALASVASIAAKVLIGIGTALAGGIVFAITNFGKALKWVLDILKDFSGFITSVFNNGVSALTTKFDKITSIFDRFNSNAEKANTVIKKMPENYGAAGESVAQFGTLTRDATKEVDKQTVALKWYEVVINKIKTVITTAVRVVVGGAAALGAAIVGFFTDFRARFSEATKDATNFLDLIKGFFVTIGSYFSDIGIKIGEFFNKLGIGELPIVQRIKEVATAIKDFIVDLGPGRLSAIAFAAAMMGLVVAAIKVAVSFTTLVTSVRRVFTTVETILKSKFLTVKSPSLIIQLAQAFAIMAGSLGLLTKLVNPDDLKKTAEVMKDLMITFTLCAGALRIIDFVISKMGLFSNFKLVNSTVLSLAISMGILVAAFAVLNKINIADDWLKKLGIMGLMFAEVAAAAVIVSKFAPKLAGGSILMLTLALAMKTMVDAFAKISDKDMEGISKNIVGFTAVFIAVAALTAAAGRVRITSALGLYIIAKSLNEILPMLAGSMGQLGPLFAAFDQSINNVADLVRQVEEDFMGLLTKLNGFFAWIQTAFSETSATVVTCVTSIGMFITAIGAMAALVAGGFAIAAIITAIGSLGNLLKGFAFAVVGVALAIKIVTDSFIQIGEYLSSLDSAQQASIMSGFATIALILTGMVGIITLIDAYASLITRNAFFNGKTARTSFLGIGAAFAGIGVAMLLVVKTLNSLEKIPEDRFWDLIKGVSLILVCLGVAAAGAGIITKGGAALLGLIGVVASFALLMAGVAILSTMWTPQTDAAMKAAFAGLIVIAASLSAVLLSLSRLKNPTSILALMIPTLLMLVTISGLLIAIGNMKELNTGGMLLAMAGLAGTIFVVIQLLNTISKSAGLGNAKKIGVLISAIGLLATAAAAIVGLAFTIKYAGGWNVVGAIVALNLQLAAIYGMMQLISKMKAVGTGLKSKIMLLGSCAGALVVVALALGGFAAAIKGIGGKYIIGAMASLNIQLGLILAMMWAITKIKIDTSFVSRIVLLGGCIVALVTCAIAIGKLAEVVRDTGVTNYNTAFNSLATTFLEVGGILAVVGIIGSTLNEWSKVVGTGALFVGAIGTIIAITHALMQLSDIDKAQLESAVQAFQAIVIAIGVMTAGLGIIQGLITGIVTFLSAGLGSWAGAVALPLLIVAIGAAVIEMGAGLYIGALAIGVLATALDKLIEPLKKLSELPLANLAVNLLALGTALAHAGIGLGIFDIAAAAATLIFALFAKSLNSVNEVLPSFISSLDELSKLDLSSVALGMAELAVAGIAMGASAGGVSSFASAMDQLAGSISSYNNASSGFTFNSRGDGKGSYGTFGGVVSAAKTAAADSEAIMETVVKKSPTYGAGISQGVSSGTLTKESAVKSATDKVIVDTTEESVKTAVESAETGGEDIANGVYNGFERATGSADKSNPLTRWWEDASSDLGDKVKNGASELFGSDFFQNIASFFKDGVQDILGDLGNLDVSSLASKLGTLFGVSFTSSAAREIQNLLKILGGGKVVSQFSSTMNNELATAGIQAEKFGKKLNTVSTKALTASEYIAEMSSETSLFGNIIDYVSNGIGEFTDGLGGMGDAAGKAGSSMKDLASTLKDTIANQLDIFSKFELKTEVSAEQMLENMRSNIEGVASWSHRLSVLAERGISQPLLQALEELGPKGYETMNAFYNMTEDQLKEANEYYSTYLTLPDSQTDILMSSWTYAGEMSIKGFSNALDDHRALHQSIHGIKQDVDKDLSTEFEMHSPSKFMYRKGEYVMQGFNLGLQNNYVFVEGTITTICERIKELFETGLDPETFGEVGSEFFTSLFASMLGGGEEGEANPIVKSFIEGFQYLDEFDEALEEFVIHIFEIFNELFEMGDEESRSERFYRYVGMWLQAIREGFNGEEGLALLYEAIVLFCETLMSYVDSQSLPEQFFEVGRSCAQGVADGIRDGIGDAVAAAIELCEAVVAATKSVEGFDINSPSKVMRKVGHSVGEGLTLGIMDGAQNVYDAAASLANDGIDGANDGIGRLQDVLSEGIDLNPVITPMLDLSLIRSQMDELAAMMSNPTYGLSGQNEGSFSGNPETQQINFTQNNYSPKALTRYEIYRQTRNQISQLKGALG